MVSVLGTVILVLGIDTYLWVLGPNRYCLASCRKHDAADDMGNPHIQGPCALAAEAWSQANLGHYFWYRLVVLGPSAASEAHRQQNDDTDGNGNNDDISNGNNESNNNDNNQQRGNHGHYNHFESASSCYYQF